MTIAFGRFNKIVILFWLMFVAGGSSTASVDGWTFLEKDRGVTMHSRKVDGYAESEFKGSLIVNQPIEVIGAVLTDIPAYTDWFFSCVQARKIPGKASTNLNFQIYIVVEPPWPLWKRDVIYQTRTRIDFPSGVVLVRGKALRETSVLNREKHVRVTDSALEWALQRLDETRTMVTFRNRINVGGNIGNLLSNLGCRKTIFESLINLDRIASEPKYAALGSRLKKEYGHDN